MEIMHGWKQWSDGSTRIWSKNVKGLNGSDEVEINESVYRNNAHMFIAHAVVNAQIAQLYFRWFRDVSSNLFTRIFGSCYKSPRPVLNFHNKVQSDQLGWASHGSDFATVTPAKAAVWAGPTGKKSKCRQVCRRKLINNTRQNARTNSFADVALFSTEIGNSTLCQHMSTWFYMTSSWLHIHFQYMFVVQFYLPPSWWTGTRFHD